MADRQRGSRLFAAANTVVKIGSLFIVIAFAGCSPEPKEYQKSFASFQAETPQDLVRQWTEHSGVSFELAPGVVGSARFSRPVKVGNSLGTTATGSMHDDLLLLNAIYGLKCNWRGGRYVVSVPDSIDSDVGIFERITRRWNETTLRGVVVGKDDKPVAAGKLWVLESKLAGTDAPPGALMTVSARKNALGAVLSPSTSIGADGQFEISFDDRRFGAGRTSDLVLQVSRGDVFDKSAVLKRGKQTLVVKRQDGVSTIDVGRAILESIALRGTVQTVQGSPVTGITLWLAEVKVPNANDTTQIESILKFDDKGHLVNNRASARANEQGRFEFEVSSPDQFTSYLIVVSDQQPGLGKSETPLLRNGKPFVVTLDPQASEVALGNLVATSAH